MRQSSYSPSSAPRRGSRIVLLALLCGALALAQGLAQSPKAPAPHATASCTSSDQCPTGQLCCPACGQPDCGQACFKPIRGHCPLFV
jgi:hypothetical protein